MADDNTQPSTQKVLTFRQEIEHVARNVTDEVVGPMAINLNSVTEMLRRLVGDPPDTNVPISLREKGLIYEMQEKQENFHEEQRTWKVANDLETETSKAERQQILLSQTELLQRVAALEANTHRLHRFFLWCLAFLTKKDDNFTIAMTKIIGGLIFVTTTSIGLWKGIVVSFHWLLKMFILLGK